MKITVRAHPRSKKNEIREVAQNSYELWFHVPPIDGKANEKIIEMLAKHFGVAKSKLTLISGAKSKVKIFRYER